MKLKPGSARRSSSRPPRYTTPTCPSSTWYVPVTTCSSVCQSRRAQPGGACATCGRGDGAHRFLLHSAARHGAIRSRKPHQDGSGGNSKADNGQAHSHERAQRVQQRSGRALFCGSERHRRPLALSPSRWVCAGDSPAGLGICCESSCCTEARRSDASRPVRSACASGLGCRRLAPGRGAMSPAPGVVREHAQSCCDGTRPGAGRDSRV